jgi:hypothetical protein
MADSGFSTPRAQSGERAEGESTLRIYFRLGAIKKLKLIECSFKSLIAVICQEKNDTPGGLFSHDNRIRARGVFSKFNFVEYLTGIDATFPGPSPLAGIKSELRGAENPLPRFAGNRGGGRRDAGGRWTTTGGMGRCLQAPVPE